MLPESFYWLLALVMGLSYLLTTLWVYIAPRWGFVDVPGGRSSHVIPKPRGAGVAIVLSILVGVCVFGLFYGLIPPFFQGLMYSGVALAIIGLADDRSPLPAWQKILFQMACAVLGLYTAKGFPQIAGFGMSVELGMIGAILAFIFVVKLTNIYNFMDGIDALAASQAIFFFIANGFFILFMHELSLPIFCFMMAGAVAGFLIWNHPPARVMMGDTGSLFLGLIIALVIIYSANQTAGNIWAYLGLMSVFLADSKVTLWRRMLRGQKIYLAHREHAYQHMAARYGHAKVVMGVMALNLIWVLPISFWAFMDYDNSFWIFLLQYIPLLILAGFLKAGRPVT